MKCQDVIVGQRRKVFGEECVCVCVYLGTHSGGVPLAPGRLPRAELVSVEKCMRALRPAEEFRETICFS